MKALAERHSEDVFVPECRDGASQTRSHRRLDAWVLLKTWSPVSTIGYEIKVSRSDWRRDEKLDAYMGLCHTLYVVAPKGIVPPDELPGGVGLLEPVGDGTRLVTRRKPTRRQIDLPVDLLLYVLMSRVDIRRERPTSDYRADAKAWKLRELREWVTTKDDRRELSMALSQKIRARFDAQEHRQRLLERQIEELRRIETRIVELGFDPGQSVNSWHVESRVNALGKIITPNILRDLELSAAALSRLRASLSDLRTPPKVDTEIEEAV